MLKKALAWILAMAVMLTAGIFAGYQMAGTVTRYSTQLTETAEKIAVVNLDEGIITDGEAVNYGSRLAVPEEASFQVTGLTQARDGIKNGEFAAYIIIPATFSQKVVSLNTQPEQSIITYEINDRLRPDIREQTVYQMVRYEKTVKNNLSYMYLAAVLREFHSAQDDVKKIKEYQQEDLKILQSIQGTDLVYFIELDSQEVYEGGLPEMDLAGHYEKNAELIDSITLSFEEYEEFGQDNFKDIIDMSEEILKDERLAEYLSQLDFLSDSDGGSLFENGEEKLLAELALYNAQLETGKELVRDNLNLAVTELEQESNLQLKAILGVGEDQQGAASVDTVNGRFQLYKAVVKDTVTTEAMQVLEIQVATDSNAALATDSNAALATDSNAGTATDSNAGTATDSNAQEDAPMAEFLEEAVKAILEQQLEGALSEDVMDEQLPSLWRLRQELEMNHLILVYLGEDRTIAELIDETLDDSDHELNQRAEELSDGFFMTFEEYYSYQIEGGGVGDILATCSNAAMAEQIKSAVMDHINEDNGGYTGSIERLHDRVMEKAERLIKTTLSEAMEAVLTEAFTGLISSLGSSLDAYGLDLESRAITLAEEEQQGLYSPVTETIAAIMGIDMEETSNLLQEDIFDPVQENVEHEMEEIDSIQQESRKEIEDLDDKLQKYDPFEEFDYRSFQRILEGLHETNNDIAEQVDAKGEEFMTFADAVDEIAYRNINGMQEKILEGNEKSNLQIEEELEEAKESRAELNQKSDLMLKNFAAKLPYTRLGNGPYAAAYEFMIDPAAVKTSSELKAEQLRIQAQETPAKTHFSVKDFYILVMALLLAAIGYAAIYRFKTNWRNGNGKDKG